MSIEYGTSANLRPGEWWTALKLTEASASRIVNRSAGDTIVSASSVTGIINTVTLEDVASKLVSGTTANSTNCAVYAFPLYDSGGGPLGLDSCFNLRLFLKPTSTPGVEDNECFIGMILFDGDTDLQLCRVGCGLSWDNTTGPKPTVWSFGGGQSEGTANVNTVYAAGYISTNLPSIKYATNSVTARGIDAVGTITIDKNTSGQHQFQGSTSPPTSRITNQAYIGIVLGRNNTGDGQKSFSFEAFYSVSGGAVFRGSRNTPPSN